MTEELQSISKGKKKNFEEAEYTSEPDIAVMLE